jgi:hypothetical protein
MTEKDCLIDDCSPGPRDEMFVVYDGDAVGDHGDIIGYCCEKHRLDVRYEYDYGFFAPAHKDDL